MKRASSKAAFASLLGAMLLLGARRGLAEEPLAKWVARGLDGSDVALQPPKEDTVTVLAWTGVDCPMSKVYRPRIERLAAEYAPRGVRWLIVGSISRQELDALREATSKLGAELTVIFDEDGALARRVGARTTTETIVLGPRLEEVYRGAVDDQYGFRRRYGQGSASPGAATFRRAAPSRHYLRGALEAALVGKPFHPSRTDPQGCALGYAPTAVEAAGEPESKVSAKGGAAGGGHPGGADAGPAGGEAAVEVTYHSAVAPLLDRHCGSCHREGGIAPFSLADYGAVKRHAAMVREVVLERRMPPWNADPAFGTFANDPSLPEEAVEAIASWVESGAPEGDASKAAPRALPEGPQLGDPDVVLEAPPFEVPAEGVLPYRYVRIPTSLTEDRWVEGAQIRSTPPGIVHHVLVFLSDVSPAPEGVKRPWKPLFRPASLLQGADPRDYGKWIARFQHLMQKDFLVGEGGGLNGFFLSTTEGERPRVFPKGQAKLLPARATLVLQVHYTPDGAPHESRTSVALRFAREPPAEPIDCRSIATVAFEIPPGAPGHTVEASTKLQRDGLLLSLRPHMHVRGKSFRYVAELPDGSKDVLLHVPSYDFDWQLDYVLDPPRRLPRGTRLRAIATFDNSAANPYNPDPSKAVYFGLQTDEEMMIGYYEVVWLDGAEGL